MPLVDDVGPDVFTKVSEGTLVRLQGDTLYIGDEVVAKGRVQTAETVAEAMTAAKDGHRGPAPGLRDQHAGVHQRRGRAC